LYCPCLCCRSFLWYYWCFWAGAHLCRVCIVCLCMYCRWRSNYQEGEGWDSIYLFNPVTCCACLKPGPGLPTSYVVVLNFRLPPWLGWSLWNICVTNDHGYVPLVVNTCRSFPHSWLITRFVTRLTRRVPLVEQELLSLPEHLIRVTRSLVLHVCFVDRCSSFCTFSFGHWIVCSSSYTDSDYLPLVSSNSS
jgi:hypothetical protein